MTKIYENAVIVDLSLIQPNVRQRLLDDAAVIGFQKQRIRTLEAALREIAYGPFTWTANIARAALSSQEPKCPECTGGTKC